MVLRVWYSWFQMVVKWWLQEEDTYDEDPSPRVIGVFND